MYGPENTKFQGISLSRDYQLSEKGPKSVVSFYVSGIFHPFEA
jgi:hypothetical protein